MLNSYKIQRMVFAGDAVFVAGSLGGLCGDEVSGIAPFNVLQRHGNVGKAQMYQAFATEDYVSFGQRVSHQINMKKFPFQIEIQYHPIYCHDKCA